jgi:hypothetical protein
MHDVENGLPACPVVVRVRVLDHLRITERTVEVLTTFFHRVDFLATPHTNRLVELDNNPLTRPNLKKLTDKSRDPCNSPREWVVLSDQDVIRFGGHRFPSPIL